jgi:hypothetical protein
LGFFGLYGFGYSFPSPDLGSFLSLLFKISIHPFYFLCPSKTTIMCILVCLTMSLIPLGFLQSFFHFVPLTL